MIANLAALAQMGVVAPEFEKEVMLRLCKLMQESPPMRSLITLMYTHHHLHYQLMSLRNEKFF